MGRVESLSSRSEDPRLIAPIIPQVRGILHAAYPDLAQAIAASIPAVAQRHLSDLRRELTSAAALDEDAALDDLPTVLEVVARVFAAEDGLEPLARLGPAHAAARYRQGFTLDEVYCEYLLLRRSLRESASRHLNRDLTQEELRALVAVMDALLASTLHSFAHQRENELRLETTALGHFLSSLAHDLRNEINGVLTTLQMLDENARRIREELRQAGVQSSHVDQFDWLLRDVGTSRDTMTSTVNAMTHLLEAERLRHHVPLDKRQVDLRKLMEGAVRSAARVDRGTDPACSHAAQRIETVCPEELQLWTDPDLLSTVFTNLLQNAVKYAPQGKIAFTARLDGGHCTIFVADQGPGIPEEKLPRLFEKFERVPGAASGGLGLGLFIVRRAVDLLGGTLSVESQLGRGTTFRVDLPHTLSGP